MLIGVSVIFYLLAGYFSSHTRSHKAHINYQKIFVIIALLLHAMVIFPGIVVQNGLIFDLSNSIVVVSFLVAILVLISSFFYTIFILDKIVYPLVALSLLLVLNPGSGTKIIPFDLLSHIVLSMSAYAILTLCFIQSILLNLQDKKLHHRGIYAFVGRLPPLQTMESLLIWGLGTGFILLSLSLISGFIFLEDIFAQHLAHKTVLSFAAWLILLTVLISRLLLGLRGRRLIVLMQISFVLLIIGYFGSKFVLEQILQYS